MPACYWRNGKMQAFWPKRIIYYGVWVRSMTKKHIKSFTLSQHDIVKLKKYADNEFKGNTSQAIRHLIQINIPTTIEDYEHHAPLKSRNWKGTGKCNPRLKGFPCPQCWGMNVHVGVDHRTVLNEATGRIEHIETIRIHSMEDEA